MLWVPTQLILKLRITIYFSAELMCKDEMDSVEVPNVYVTVYVNSPHWFDRPLESTQVKLSKLIGKITNASKEQSAIEEAVMVADAQGLLTLNKKELGDAIVFVIDVDP